MLAGVASPAPVVSFELPTPSTLPVGDDVGYSYDEKIYTHVWVS